MKKVILFLLFNSLIMAAVAGTIKEGVLVFEYGDSHQANGENHIRYHLQAKEGIFPLSLSDAFEQRMPIRAWQGSKVAVTFKNNEVSRHAPNSIQMMELLEGLNGGSITGAQPWVSILCKFSDVAVEPENLSFFQDMYANLPAGLDHYWREVSYNAINVVGSKAIDWVNLPKTRIEYVPLVNNDPDADLSLLFNDCTAAVDPLVNFATGANGNSFVGINMMFNDVLDCCAWGGARYASLDGLNKLWRTTWNPPWSFANEGVIAHEMGHGFGLPHANNSDEDSNPYDNPWDVMSAATGYGVDDAIYGRLGKHINMEFKHNLGWVNDTDGFIANPGSDDVFLIAYSAIPATGGNRFARIPLSNGTHYVVEVRIKVGNYESNLPGNAVIIHHVNQCRNEPPWVVDGDAVPANYSDTEGVMWKTGESFLDPIDDYLVTVLNEFTNGFNVKIKASDDLIVRRGFEAVCF